MSDSIRKAAEAVFHRVAGVSPTDRDRILDELRPKKPRSLWQLGRDKCYSARGSIASGIALAGNALVWGW